MSSRYAVGGKRKSSQAHARRAWACPCGKVTYGNGGKSSHQRACRIWAEHRLAVVEKSLAEIGAGTSSIPAGSVEHFRSDHEHEAEALRRRLAPKRRWVVGAPFWSWLLEGAGRRVELERRRWSPGDVPSGFYLHVAETEDCSGLFGLAMYAGSLAEAKAEALSALGALEDGTLSAWMSER